MPKKQKKTTDNDESKNGQIGQIGQNRIYKENEFDAFLDMLRGGNAAHWVQIAESLNVARSTINIWKQLPAAQKAIRDGIETAMESMEKAGKDDWKMWESKLKMLGISPVDKSKVDHTTLGKEIPTPIYGGKSTPDKKV
ncbi:MAG TPA: hypothetical protein ENH82_00400 [bacterium]|nr:hypothetical protein [bacterium]